MYVTARRACFTQTVITDRAAKRSLRAIKRDERLFFASYSILVWVNSRVNYHSRITRQLKIHPKYRHFQEILIVTTTLIFQWHFKKLVKNLIFTTIISMVYNFKVRLIIYYQFKPLNVCGYDSLPFRIKIANK